MLRAIFVNMHSRFREVGEQVSSRTRMIEANVGKQHIAKIVRTHSILLQSRSQVIQDRVRSGIALGPGSMIVGSSAATR